jgi:16S rRNA processing protein RimM
VTQDSEPPSEPLLLEVGRVARSHGLRGEVIVDLVSNVPGRLAPGSVLVCGPGSGGPRSGGPSSGAPGFGEDRSADAGARSLEVVASRPHQGRHIVTFAGVDDRDAADRLHGTTLRAPAVTDPDPEVLFVHDLIGSTLVDQDGGAHGRVVSIEANPASDLLVLEDGGMVPMRFVVAREPGRIRVDIPTGLLE